MTAPIIGITTGRITHKSGTRWTGIPESYVQAIQQVGGLPILLPYGITREDLQALIPHLDGILLSGGGDIDPRYFKGDHHETIDDIMPDRDQLEVGLVRYAAQNGLPFFGICRGCQVINVALGGNLYTHIPDQYPNALRHKNLPEEKGTHLAHSVTLEEGTLLLRVMGATHARVNSRHHQAVKDVAPGLKVNAYAEDNLIEGVELPDHPFGLAVQWHPEWLVDDPAMLALFQAFVDAARKTSSDKR